MRNVALATSWNEIFTLFYLTFLFYFTFMILVLVDQNNPDLNFIIGLYFII